eukprot:7126718-Pyramimonas_sp.AAC.1
MTALHPAPNWRKGVRDRRIRDNAWSVAQRPRPNQHGNSMPAAKSTAAKRLQAGNRGPRLCDRQRRSTSDQEVPLGFPRTQAAPLGR